MLILGFVQNVCKRRQAVFDQLVAAYGTLQKQVAELTREKEAQQTRIAELKGESLPISPVQPLPG